MRRRVVITDPDVKPGVVRIPLHLIDEPNEHEIAVLSEIERAKWRRLRSLFLLAEGRGPFDPRHVMRMDTKQLETWRRARREWLREIFANEPTVLI